MVAASAWEGALDLSSTTTFAIMSCHFGLSASHCGVLIEWKRALMAQMSFGAASQVA